MKWPTMDEFAKSVAEKALDEIEYNGKTIRQWIEIISATELGTNLAEVGTDCISRQAAIDEGMSYINGDCFCDKEDFAKYIEFIEQLPPIQPDKDKVSDLLYRIYSNQSPHLDMNGVIAKKYYCEELWKELFGKESELPGWMT